MSSAGIEQTPFVKQLAANDRPTRDEAVRSLRTFLSGRRALPPMELLKLWKGLFYCMWMSDRPRTQQALCNELAGLVAILPRENTIPFLRAFWQTMAREWTNIDVLRMDKFLLLTRRYVGAMFTLLRDKDYEETLLDEMLALLEEIPLNAKDQRLPNGMRFHVIDVYVDELERIGALPSIEENEEEDEEKAEAPLEKLLSPLTKLIVESPTKPVRERCRVALDDDRITGKAPEAEPESIEEGGAWEGFGDE